MAALLTANVSRPRPELTIINPNGVFGVLAKARHFSNFGHLPASVCQVSECRWPRRSTAETIEQEAIPGRERWSGRCLMKSGSKWPANSEQCCGICRKPVCRKSSRQWTAPGFCSRRSRVPSAPPGSWRKSPRSCGQDPELVARLAQYEQGLSRHPKILIRLSQLTTQCLECPSVEGRPFASLARNFS